MGDVKQFPGLFYGDTPAVDALENAKQIDFESVLIIGQDKDGNLQIAANHSEMKDMLWLIQRAVWWLGRQEEVLGS